MDNDDKPVGKELAVTRNPTPDTLFLLRRILLAILAFGILGLVAELLLLEHIKSPTQLIPFALLLWMAGGVALVYFRPNRTNLRLFQVSMILVALGGLVGVWEHLEGNLEFARELSPSLSGLPLIWKALHKGAPVLAPGVMLQMALLGLAFTFRHPAWAERRGERGARAARG